MTLNRLLAVGAALCVCSPAFAQDTGTLHVTVVDNDHLEVPNATVTVASPLLDAALIGTTGPGGEATFGELPVGNTYIVTIESVVGQRRFDAVPIRANHTYSLVAQLEEVETLVVVHERRIDTQSSSMANHDPSGRSYQTAIQMAERVPANPETWTPHDHLSTFAADVDTASYTLNRNILLSGHRGDPRSVRVEEFVNYFDYDYPQPTGDAPLAAALELVPSPFDPDSAILRVGIQGRDLSDDARPPYRLTFLVDVSGSMSARNKLPLAQKALHTLVDGLGPEDKVAIGTYAGHVKELLPPTYTTRKAAIHSAIDRLSSGGSTAMNDGIGMAYRMAQEMQLEGAENRVIVLSDGDANVGAASHEAILKSISGYAGKGITLSTVGFGTGNYRDVLMEQLADNGDGNASYIDSEAEIDRVFGERLESTMTTLARDVKLQVDFDPSRVKTYRLLGYENRDIADEDFRNDDVDAGEIGSGHQVTALYELTLTSETSGRLATVRMRAKPAGRDAPAQEWTASIDRGAMVPLSDAASDTQLALGIATFAQKLRNAPQTRELSWSDLRRTLGRSVDTNDPLERELLELVDRAKTLADGGSPNRY